MCLNTIKNNKQGSGSREGYVLHRIKQFGVFRNL